MVPIAAGMAGAPGLQQVERLGAAHLADRDAVGAQPKRRLHEIGKRGHAVLGAERHEVRRGALQLARVLDQHDPVAGPGDLGEQRVDERRLAGRGAAGDEDVACARRRPAAATSACAGGHDPGRDVVVEREHGDSGLADGEGRRRSRSAATSPRSARRSPGSSAETRGAPACTSAPT